MNRKEKAIVDNLPQCSKARAHGDDAASPGEFSCWRLRQKAELNALLPRIYTCALPNSLAFGRLRWLRGGVLRRTVFLTDEEKILTVQPAAVCNTSHMASGIIDGAELRSIRSRLGLSQAKLAEITGISQANLSAFELGKSVLRNPEIARVNEVLSKKESIDHVVNRKKRYREHEFGVALRDPARPLNARRTSGNENYVKLLSTLDKERLRGRKEGGPTALSLFSGCGGFSTGFTWAGFTISGFLELNPDFRAIYRENFPTSEELGSDITKVSKDEAQDWNNRLGPIDAIIGGPPCQGFSLSGKRKADDSRNTLFEHYLRLVDVIRPRIAVLENVRLLTSMRSVDGGLVKDAIQTGFQKLGYFARAFEVNAKEYGVPQHRERVLFVAVRNDQKILPSIPYATHGPDSELFDSKLPYVTFGDACSDLEYLESGESSANDALHETVHHPRHVIDWLWDVPQGKSAHENEDPAMRPPSGYNTTYKRQVWLEPASTVQTTFGMISGSRNVHPIATRALTVREAARIQSFPDSYKFTGSLGAIRTSIGNAVPPLLGYHIAQHLKKEVLDLVKVSCF